jgi:H+/Cl- antiporter ClcA
MAGAGAGFGAAIGTPWAGAVFGMEVLFVGRFKLIAVLECVIASFTAYYITFLLRAPHSVYPAISIEPFHLKTAFFILIAGFIFGLAARFFIFCTHVIERICARIIPYAPLRPFFVGMIIIILFYIEGTYRFAGLGIDVIQNALSTSGPLLDPAFKTLFTALTIGSGFKGGEFIPLVFIGTTLGSALILILPISFQLLAGVGFAAVFAGAANTPIACTIMAVEIFGLPIAPYALLGCFGSFLFSGSQGIYKSQKQNAKKFF